MTLTPGQPSTTAAATAQTTPSDQIEQQQSGVNGTKLFRPRNK